MHEQPHILAGKHIILNATAADPLRDIVIAGAVFHLEDWADRVMEVPNWRMAANWTTKHYVDRLLATGRKPDDDVVYGKIDHLGHMVHVSELGEEATGGS